VIPIISDTIDLLVAGNELTMVAPGKSDFLDEPISFIQCAHVEEVTIGPGRIDGGFVVDDDLAIVSGNKAPTGKGGGNADCGEELVDAVTFYH
jgi:hypothetical protein